MNLLNNYRKIKSFLLQTEDGLLPSSQASAPLNKWERLRRRGGRRWTAAFILLETKVIYTL